MSDCESDGYKFDSYYLPNLNKNIKIFKNAISISVILKKNIYIYDYLIYGVIQDKKSTEIKKKIEFKDFFFFNETLEEMAVPLLSYLYKKNNLISKTLSIYFFLYFVQFNHHFGSITTNNLDKQLGLVFDNRRHQFYSNINVMGRLIKSFSNGFFLKLFEFFKKELKKKKSSTLLHLKSVLTVCKKNFFKHDYYVFIKGIKKKIYSLLNICKFKMLNLKILFLFYLPAVSISIKKYKKIKSIKKRLKKKYIYSEKLV